jgi:hypothetical protein
MVDPLSSNPENTVGDSEPVHMNPLPSGKEGMPGEGYRERAEGVLFW